MKPEVFKKLFEQRKRERMEFRVHNFVVVREDMVDLDTVLEKLKNMPQQLFSGVEKIIFGNFDILRGGGKVSVYKDGKIFIDIDSDEKMYSAVVHELAHLIESYRSNEVYMDGEIKREFIRKRLKLFQAVEGHFPEINFDKRYYVTSSYNSDFDDFLTRELGYNRFMTIAKGLFVSPYAATSLSEYWARNFEEYFSDSYVSRNNLTKIAPAVYAKVEKFVN